MARKVSATTKKRAVKPTCTPKNSQASSEPSLVDRVEAQRVQIMKALSIIECCKNASATLLNVDDSEYMVPAFETVNDLLSTSSEELEHIASSMQRLTEPRE